MFVRRFSTETIRDRARRLQTAANQQLSAALSTRDYEDYAVTSALAALAYSTVARRRREEMR